MVQHVGPASLELTAVPLDVGKPRQLYALEDAFLAQYGDELLLFGSGLGVAVEIDDIVKVARPRALAQRPKLLGKGFNIIVGEHLDAFLGGIAKGMKNFGDRGRQDDAFVGRQVELNSG
jgi:hypothetical protein